MAGTPTQLALGGDVGALKPADVASDAPLAHVFSVVGVPPASLGVNGDIAFRRDAPGVANQRIYIKNNSGVWNGIL